MAITVTPNLTNISYCESTTGWSGGALNDAYQLQGTYCLGEKVSEGTQTARTYTLAANVNMTGKFIIMTMIVAGLADTKANGGYRIVVYDGTGNYGTWYVAGNDTHPGGWGYFAIDPSTVPTYYNGSINTSQTLIDYTDVDRVGIQMKVLSKAVGTAPNIFWDVCWYGTGLKVTSGSTDRVNFDDLATASAAGFWGIVQKINSVFFTQGLIEYDDGITGIDVDSDGDIVIWKENEFIPDSLSGLKVNGYSAGTVNISLKNCVFKGAGSQKPYIDLSDSDIDTGIIQGCTFVNFAPSTFAGMDSIAGSAFDNCGQVITEGCVIGTTTFRNSVATNGAFLFPSDSSKVSDLSFILCDNDIEYASTSDATTPTFTNIIHDDNAGDYDVNNTSGSAVEIALSGTSNANSYTGSAVTFQTSSTLIMTVKDKNGSPVGDAYAFIDDDDAEPYIMNTLTNSSTGIASVSWTGGLVSNARWRVRKYGYKPFKIITDIPATGTKDIPVTLDIDPQQT